MSNWECGVCGYLTKEDKPPEKCPICDAPEKMFNQLDGGKDEGEKAASQPSPKKKWRCTVCGYEVTDIAPPEKCPVCDAPAEMFEEVIEVLEKPPETTAATDQRWRCTVCGYIHNGPEPPEKCPVCAASKKMFVEIDAEGKAISEIEAEEPVALNEAAAPQPKTLFDRLADLVLKLHLHPITVHFPNGILPAAVVFLALAVYFNIVSLEVAAYYNFIFVLIMLPMVLLTGFIEWQKRYKGIRTAIFITKIICSLVVIAAANILVFWRLLDPQVTAAGSPTQLIYLAVAAGMLGAAGIAGHLGGKLVFGSRS